MSLSLDEDMMFPMEMDTLDMDTTEKRKMETYEKILRRYRTLESAATRLQKEAKGYLDSLRGMY